MNNFAWYSLMCIAGFAAIGVACFVTSSGLPLFAILLMLEFDNE